MYTIRYVIPYFGKLPDYFGLWLDTCKANPDVSWLLYTDDRTEYSFPENVEVAYCSFEELRLKIQEHYDFPVKLGAAYKLCDYKVAYGEIFSEELKGYDFWGFCDLDMMWGKIRNVITDEILEKYPKIGCQGHSTIFRNDPVINSIYRNELEGTMSYREVFSTDKTCCTDIGYIRKRFEALGLPIYDRTVYAGIDAYKPAFYLQATPPGEKYKNKRQIFLWDRGVLTRYYLVGSEVKTEEMYYIHFFRRPMKNQIKTVDEPVLIVPNRYFNFDGPVTAATVKRYGKKSKLSFLIRMAYQNRKKIGVKKVIEYIEFQIGHDRNTKVKQERG